MTGPVVELILDDINPRRLISANRRIHHMVRAEVWDEGHRAGYEDRRSETQFIRFVSENPYRHTPEAP